MRKKPVEYSPELGDSICAELAGGTPLKTICEKPGRPDRTTVYSWVREHESFSRIFWLARLDCAHSYADNAVAVMLQKPKDNVEAQHFRNQAQVYLHLAGRLNPRRYGERLEIANDPDAPITPVDRFELARQIAFILKRATIEQPQPLLQLPMAERVHSSDTATSAPQTLSPE